MTFSITTKPRLVLTSVKCLVVFAVVCAAGSYEAPAHGWERSKVGSGKIEYRLPELIKDPATARTCLIDGFGKQADAAGDKKDVKVFSQFGEDGILSYMFNCIGVATKTYVELGTQDASECNTRLLREKYGWTGLMLDGDFNDSTINLQKELLYTDNIVHLLARNNVSFVGVDLLSIDIDLNTFWVLREILAAGYLPRVIISEMNANFEPDQSFATVYIPNETWVDTAYFGASSLAFERLVKQFGYSTVFVEANGVNIFFVHNSAIGGTPLGQSVMDAKFAYEHEGIHSPCSNTPWLRVRNRTPFHSPDFRKHMPMVMLRHHNVGARRRLHTINMDPAFKHMHCALGDA